MSILIVVGDETTPIRAEQTAARYGQHPDAQAYVDSLVASWSGAGPGVDADVIRDPIGPASGLRAHLAEQPAGLVALTTHARSGIDRARLGAQAANIVHASVAPCLVAPVQ